MIVFRGAISVFNDFRVLAYSKINYILCFISVELSTFTPELVVWHGYIYKIVVFNFQVFYFENC